jgi:hypothetical protein
LTQNSEKISGGDGAQDERHPQADPVTELEEIGEAPCNIEIRTANIHEPGQRRVHREHLGASERLFATVAFKVSDLQVHAVRGADADDRIGGLQHPTLLVRGDRGPGLLAE